MSFVAWVDITTGCSGPPLNRSVERPLSYEAKDRFGSVAVIGRLLLNSGERAEAGFLATSQ
jgi:hypothetical protein